MEVYFSLVGRVSESMIRENCIPTIKRMLELKKPIKMRKDGASMLGGIGKEWDQTFIMKHVIKLIFYYCQDPNWNIRKIMAIYLKDVCKKLSK